MGVCVECCAFPRNLARNDYTDLLGDRLKELTYRVSGGRYATIYAGVYDPPNRPYMTFIYVHANSETLYALNYYLEYAASVFGCRFVAFDWEGYGLATGRYSGEAKLLRGCDEVYQYVRNGLGIAPEDIGFWGRSIGTVGAAYLASRHPDAYVAILQSPLASAFNVVFKRVICPACDALEAHQHIKSVQVPIILIHGKKDYVVDFRNSYLLFDVYVASHYDDIITTDADNWKTIQRYDNYFPGMGRWNYGKIEFFQIACGGHNDLDSVFKRYMYHIIKTVIYKKVGPVWG